MKRFSFWITLAAILGVAGLGHVALADGTEELGTPGITIAGGTGLLAAGTGTEAGNAGTIEITVPADKTVEEVILYWVGRPQPDTVPVPSEPTMTIMVNEQMVIGDLIGGGAVYVGQENNPTPPPGQIPVDVPINALTYRAVITGLDLIQPGVAGSAARQPRARTVRPWLSSREMTATA